MNRWQRVFIFCQMLLFNICFCVYMRFFIAEARIIATQVVT